MVASAAAPVSGAALAGDADGEAGADFGAVGAGEIGCGDVVIGDIDGVVEVAEVGGAASGHFVDDGDAADGEGSGDA